MALPLWAKKPAPFSPLKEIVARAPRRLTRRDIDVGIALLFLGGLSLLSLVVSPGLLIVPFCGFALIVQGIRTRRGIFLLYGGLLSGIGMGFLLTAVPFYPAHSDMAGGVFLISCALGLFSIFLLSQRFTRQPQWWPLIPGGMMALTGLVLII